MGVIRVLPSSVVAKIAAGEMIERPVSVVKELVENAIDAAAERITVSVEGSLDRAVSVIDDGIGMSRDDVATAIRRHATSKIREADDLFRVASLGFRGEALPSIAAVSSLVITSRSGTDQAATRIEVVAGEVLDVRDASRTRGTTVEVRDLYFNVPVRRKFMKTERGELRAAMRLVSHLALAYPGIRFAFERAGAAPIVFDATASLAERAAQIYGRATAERMLPVSWSRDGVSVRGLVGVPEQSRATRDYQVMIVNGRTVVSPLLNHAARTAYRDLLPHDRHPMCVLAIEVDPELIDVNVHPTKREVKFAHEGTVFQTVRDGVAGALQSLRPSGVDGVTDRVREGPRRVPGPWPERGDGDASTPAQGAQLSFDSRPSTREILEFWSRPGQAARAGETFDAEAPPERRARADEPKFWQLHRRYIFAQTSSGVLVIDQHAAHERILYERALARLDGQRGASQRLLIAEPIELTASEFEILSEIGDELEQLGFEIEPFGGRAVIVRAVPADVYETERGQLIRDLIDEYVNTGRSVRATRERVARAFSCRAAIKSGTALAPEEMRDLIDALFATGTPHGDPHGRPTLIQFSLDELDRRFGRS